MELFRNMKGAKILSKFISKLTISLFLVALPTYNLFGQEAQEMTGGDTSPGFLAGNIENGSKIPGLSVPASSTLESDDPYGFIILGGGGTLFINNDNYFVGGNVKLTMPFTSSRKDLLSLELSSGNTKKEQIGRYDYTTTRTKGKTIYEDTYDNGKIFTLYNYLDLTLSYNRLIPASKRWGFQLGPGAGFIRYANEDRHSNSRNVHRDQAGLSGLLVKANMIKKYKPMIGLNAIVQWMIPDNFGKIFQYIEIDYRFSYSSPVYFPERSSITVKSEEISVGSKEFNSLGHRISIVLGWGVR
jgi:hypothetical protein